jgi:hypothetical protein
MSPILGNFDGSIFTPVNVLPVCFGKNGITTSAPTGLDGPPLRAPPGIVVPPPHPGKPIVILPVGNNGAISILPAAGPNVNPFGIMSAGLATGSLSMFLVIDLTNAKPIGILSKATNLLILHLFLLL